MKKNKLPNKTSEDNKAFSKPKKSNSMSKPGKQKYKHKNFWLDEDDFDDMSILGLEEE